jgi:glyoxylase-like metal-dependent hydrolase (beta-lactamase superfamily II)
MRVGIVGGSRVRVHVFTKGYIEANGVGFVGRDGRESGVTARFMDRCYLIEHPRGMLLWDTGLADGLAVHVDGLVAGQYRLVVERTLPECLTGVGTSVDEVSLVGFSHLHSDHAGNARLFPHATLLAGAREWETALQPDPPYGYNPTHYEMLRGQQRIETDDGYDVFGDGAVVILATPGHTPGHQALLLRLDETGPLVLTCDLAYSIADWHARRAPGWNTSFDDTWRSMDRIDELVAELGARMLSHHDAIEPLVGEQTVVTLG